MSENRFVVETALRVRYAETDAMGIVHHSNYIVFFEVGRSEYSRHIGYTYREFEKSGYYLTVTDVNVRYHRPAVYDQEVIIRTWVDELKSRGMTFGYEVVDAVSKDVLVTGSTKHICITHAGKVTHLPDVWKRHLQLD